MNDINENLPWAAKRVVGVLPYPRERVPKKGVKVRGGSHFSSKRHRLFSQPSYLQTIIKHVACEPVHNMWVRWLFCFECV